VEKISGIIKSSPRVQAVDIRESTGLRPGTPLFGRTEGVSSLAKLDAKLEVKPELDASFSAAKKATAVTEELAGWKAKDQMRASIAAELSNKFFARPSQNGGEDMGVSAAPPVPVSSFSLPLAAFERPSNPSGFKSEAMKPLNSQNFNALPDPGPSFAQPEGLFPRGSFIDRIA
jgi:hypothetical protein